MKTKISNQQVSEFFKRQPLLKGLDEIELSYLVDISEKMIVGPKQLIFSEGDTSDDLYLIFDGEVAIFKKGEDDKEYTLATLSTGETFGELAFFDNAPRSSSVRAMKESILIKISKEASHSSSSEMTKVFHHIGNNIAKITLERIRLTNASSVQSTSNEIKHLHNRLFLGKLFVAAVLVNWGFGIISKKFDSSYTQSTLQAFIVSLILLVVLIRHYGSLENFGIKPLNFSNGLKQVLWIMATLSLLTLALFLLGQYIHAVYPNMRWINFTPIVWDLPLLFYPVIVLLKEFIARGVIQTSLEEVLINDKLRDPSERKIQSFFHNKSGKAALLTAAIIALFYLDYGIGWALIAFFINLFLCWIFIRIRSIFGTALVHIVIGILFVVLSLIPQSVLYKV